MDTVAEYYAWLVDTIRHEVEETEEDQAVGYDRDTWVDHLTSKYALEPITAKFADIKMQRLSRSGRHDAALITVPVVPSSTFDVIRGHALSGTGRWRHVDYRAFFSTAMPYTLCQATEPHEEALRAAQRLIQQYVESLNGAIQGENTTVRDRVDAIVMHRQQRIRATRDHFDALSAAIAIPLKRKAEDSEVVPTALGRGPRHAGDGTPGRDQVRGRPTGDVRDQVRPPRVCRPHRAREGRVLLLG